ncbi:MAG: aspartate kinase [Chloroflexi bacterium HGW-Chloroflexi-3]|nr:MAG: aspartate kinase [Chloroflexi bacterium HGW-Chloroflexi-3]
MAKTNTLVMKFGGTSVGSLEGLAQVVKIVRQATRDWRQVVVVSSAFSKVTDALFESAQQAAQGNQVPFAQTLAMLTKRHHQALQHFAPTDKAQVLEELDVLIQNFQNLVQAIGVLGEGTPRALDAVVGLGECLAVRVIAAILSSQGIPAQAVDATQLIVSDNQFQASVPLMRPTQETANQVLVPLFKQGLVPVVTGFIAATAEGIPTTLGRGGSDYSAAILGVVLDADEIWIWTDVDGVMTADPRLAKDARTIPELSYREVSELAYFGARVLHPKTIRPVVEAGKILKVLNTFNPSHPGTIITDDLSEIDLRNENGQQGGIIKAVTAVRGVQLITVEGRGMLGVPGVAARIFSAVATTGATVPFITEASSEQSLCFAVPADMSDAVLTVLEKSLAHEIENRNIDRVWVSEEVVIVTAVCPQMRYRWGVAGKIFTALAESKVNVLAIAHGSSEVSISLVVNVSDLETTIQALHQLTINGQALAG